MIEKFEQIDQKTDEGKLCIMLLAEVTTASYSKKTPDETIQEITKQYKSIFD